VCGRMPLITAWLLLRFTNEEAWVNRTTNRCVMECGTCSIRFLFLHRIYELVLEAEEWRNICWLCKACIEWLLNWVCSQLSARVKTPCCDAAAFYLGNCSSSTWFLHCTLTS
jgi:hypothetical protein